MRKEKCEMKAAPIRDIRIYRSQIENVSGNPLPNGFVNMTLAAAARRITMKLQEHQFTMSGFHHLYLNLTTCAVEDQIAPAKREPDRYYPWYRYYDVQISSALYDALESPDSTQPVIGLLETVFQKFFSTAQFPAEMIHGCISEAVTQGEQMLVKFKEKTTAKNHAVICLRYSDNGKYIPLLRVFDTENHLLLEKDLPETDTLEAYGEIRLSAKKVIIQPRKNRNLEPMTFML